jgi:squalene synthase HpnC
MTGASDLASGKGHHDENFPVASVLIHPRHRPPILAYYRFARAADDVSDHPTASADEKLDILDGMRRSLVGESDTSAEAVALRTALAKYRLTPQHGLDLLEAFRRDVTLLRYPDWDALMDYCRFSAMPVGRYVLDVHGEDRAATWPASDALCAALQVINHLQDCGKDFRNLDRVYLPQDMLAAANVDVSALGAAQSTPGLRRVITDLSRRTVELRAAARPLAGTIRDRRLGLEVSVIQRLAEDLNARLSVRDPFCQRVHHRKAEALGLAARAAMRFLLMRMGIGKTSLVPVRGS